VDYKDWVLYGLQAIRQTSVQPDHYRNTSKQLIMKHAAWITTFFTVTAALLAKAEGEANFETCERQLDIEFPKPSVWGVHKFADAVWDESSDGFPTTVSDSLHQFLRLSIAHRPFRSVDQLGLWRKGQSARLRSGMSRD
jgi:hypothetical protein